MRGFALLGVLSLIALIVSKPLHGAQNTVQGDLEKLQKYQGACDLAADDESYDPAKAKNTLKALKGDCRKGLKLALSLLKKNPSSKEVRYAAQKIDDSAEGAGVNHRALSKALGK